MLGDKVIVRVATGPGKWEDLEVVARSAGGSVEVEPPPSDKGAWTIVERGPERRRAVAGAVSVLPGSVRERLYVSPSVLLTIRTVNRR